MKDIQTYRHETRRATVRRVNYSSLAEFASDCRLAGVVKNYTHAGDSTWWGGDSMGTLLDKCLSGEERHIAKAESLIEQLREEIEIPRSTWSPSAYGAFPDVGSFLAGEIECMRHMQSDPSATTPVRIYFDPTSWAGIDASDLVERGVAALALTMALAQMRPVELWTYSDLDSRGEDLALICAQIQTNPLMLSEACFALCNPGYARGLTYGLAEIRMGFEGMWGFGDYDSDPKSRAELMREALKASPDDIIIPGAGERDELIKDPVGFIRRELARHRHALETA